jgi:hypothetical protein
MQALTSNTTGNHNSGFGYDALQQNTTGASNVAVGYQALISNTTASNNTAVGYQALYSNTTGTNNTAIGYLTLDAVTTGNGNVAFGNAAGGNLSTGSSNTFIGEGSGSSTTSDSNTFLGRDAGYLVTSGAKNTIIGRFGGDSGGLDIRTNSNYVVLSDGDGNLGIYGKPGASDWVINTGTSGTLYCQGVYTFTTASSANVFVNSGGAFLRSTSALKYKTDVRDLERVDISKFRAVRYKSNCEKDDQTKDYFGFIADEVDEAGVKELVSYGDDGQVEGFQYERMTAVLLKELQELKAEFNSYKASHP